MTLLNVSVTVEATGDTASVIDPIDQRRAAVDVKDAAGQKPRPVSALSVSSHVLPKGWWLRQ